VLKHTVQQLLQSHVHKCTLCDPTLRSVLGPCQLQGLACSFHSSDCVGTLQRSHLVLHLHDSVWRLHDSVDSAMVVGSAMSSWSFGGGGG
jgi:hypothetical protein